ncbi:MAG TPA: RNA-binding protein [Hyphomicrobiales bacterium]|nr:RNA-binding protein [Hyphomicrobiales bacterium]
MAKTAAPLERTCIVGRATLPVDELIRFVLAPDGTVVPDLKRDLPGRGVWVTASAEAVATAEKKRLFARGFKAEVRVEPGLAERVGTLLERAALGALAMANKAGLVVTGFGKVETALGRDAVAVLIHASDAAPDGIRKLAAVTKRRFGDGPGVPVVRSIASEQLDLALGRSNVIHAAVLEGRAAAAFLERERALVRFRASGADGTAAEESASGATKAGDRPAGQKTV